MRSLPRLRRAILHSLESARTNASGATRTGMKKFWQFTLVGLAEGVVLGWLLSRVSGNIFVSIGIGTLGTVVGIVLGIIHRNDR